MDPDIILVSESQFYKMHSIVLVEDIPFQRCFCDFFIIQSRITTLKNSKGNIKEINSISQLSISLVLRQSGLRGQEEPAVAALLDPMHSAWDFAWVISLDTHDSSVRHVASFPVLQMQKLGQTEFQHLLKLANTKSGIYTQVDLISNLFS